MKFGRWTKAAIKSFRTNRRSHSYCPEYTYRLDAHVDNVGVHRWHKRMDTTVLDMDVISPCGTESGATGCIFFCSSGAVVCIRVRLMHANCVQIQTDIYHGEPVRELQRLSDTRWPAGIEHVKLSVDFVMHDAHASVHSATSCTAKTRKTYFDSTSRA